MLINNGIRFIELKAVVDDVPMVYRPLVIWDDKDVILVDTGLPGMFEMIRDNLAKLPIGKLNKIIITHQDYDHLGSLSEIINTYDHDIEVYAHELTKPYIEGDKTLIKKGFIVPGTKVDYTISDGETLPFCGGIQVITTPGHTPDHISLYHQSTKTLIAGDALTVNGGELQYPNKVYTLDMERAIQSLNKFLDYEIDTVICYHGGVCKNNIKNRLLFLAGRK